MNMLQSMSVALSEIRAQLCTVQQQYAKQDEQLKMIQETIKANQEKPTTIVASTSKKSRKSPRGLSVS